MNYKLQQIYEAKNTGSTLTIGKYKLVDGYPIDEYDYEDAIARKLISKATQKNMYWLTKCGVPVTFDKVYRADLSKGSGRMSTFIAGTYDGKEFVWVRKETKSRAAGQTRIYFEKLYDSGTSFLARNYKPTITIEDGLYRVENEYNKSIVYFKDKQLTIKHNNEDGPGSFYHNYHKTYMWFSNNKKHRLSGPAIIASTIWGDTVYDYYINSYNFMRITIDKNGKNSSLYLFGDQII